MPIVCTEEFPLVPINANSADPSRAGGGGSGAGGAWADAIAGLSETPMTTSVDERIERNQRVTSRWIISLCTERRYVSARRESYALSATIDYTPPADAWLDYLALTAGLSRTMQRNPRWLVEVSIGSGKRAAGR